MLSTWQARIYIRNAADYIFFFTMVLIVSLKWHTSCSNHISYKNEVITPIPKEHPVITMEMLGLISSLLSFNKVQEMLIVEMVVSDLILNLDPTQYGNRKRTSNSHYLVRLLHRILFERDRNSKGEINTALCLFIDWKQAYS